jgi:hypothetical protein
MVSSWRGAGSLEATIGARPAAPPTTGDVHALTQPPHHEPGTVLDGKYEVLRHLGGGGMGEVYLVRHIHLGE